MRLVLLLAALLLTTATSVRSPYYPRFAPEHSGTVYLHNASLRSVDAHVALLRPDAKVDCEAVLAGSPDRLSARDFLPRRKWTMRTGENVPLWSPREGEQRACHVVLVRIDRRTWAVTWRDGTPAPHPFPHESRPGTPPTDGGIRAMSNGAVWMLTPPDGVVAIQLDERQHLCV